VREGIASGPELGLVLEGGEVFDGYESGKRLQRSMSTEWSGNVSWMCFGRHHLVDYIV
jgi:hypothetical protein